MGALAAPTSMALACRWRSRPQHQDRIGSDAHNWLRRHCLGGSLSCASSKGEDDVDVEAGKFRRKGRQFLHASCCSSILYEDSLPLIVAEVAQAVRECFAARRIC